ncbi:interferon-induced 35 kDa protein [Oceanobacillus picturae]|uniref:Interferon-induced 35 kDa protein n=1 Tax=Oceanobacillus picturae TaxID=171693 RepID=A0A0U9HD25_9BACI|nr:hypothetical protein [Oceanobacillus picturae]GAQ17988.1 interferon-induced 35 kDa protein [Oceanobacillus picturae]
MKYANGITKKNKLKQFFCKHKNVGSYTEQTEFQTLSGETVLHICKDCGTLMGKQFLEYEGMGFK